MKIFVLGCGNVGKAIVTDLSGIHEVWVGDREPIEILGCAGTMKLDASDHTELKRAITDMDMVVCALPSFLGYGVLEACIETGIDVVDVSFSPENPLILHKDAEEAGVSVVVDAGFGPGLTNLFVGSISDELDAIDECFIKIGGLPKYPQPPLFYESTWCMRDLIEEYTREARMISGGEIVRRTPLESIDSTELMGYRLDEFYSDGLRTLLDTVEVGTMEETTLRWPGHLDKIKVLYELGFFDDEHVDGTIDILAPLMKNSGNDVSIMSVIARGPIDGDEHTVSYELNDEASGDFSSMSRTTGFTTAAVARSMAEGLFDPGVIPLEFLGMDRPIHDRIVADLVERGIKINRKTTYTV